MRETFFRMLVSIFKGTAAGIIVCVLLTLMLGCKSTEYVPIESSHVEHHWHTDSVKQIDSVISEKNTIIRELDSAAMVEYGIKLKNAERAFLVQTQEFEKQIQKLMKQKSDTAFIEKEVQTPVPVERKLSFKERVFLIIGKVSIVPIILCVIAIIILIYTRRSKG